MASVRKLKADDPKSPWVCEYTDAAGKRRRITPKTGLKKDADAARRRIEAELERGQHIASSEALTIKQLGERYIRHCEDRRNDGRIGACHLRGIKAAFDKSIFPSLGSMKVTELKSLDVEEFYRSMCREYKLHPTTARERVRMLRQMEEYAVKRGFMHARPAADGLRDLRGIKATRIKTFTQENVLHLLKTAAAGKPGGRARNDAVLNCYLNIAAFCGLRWGEISALTLRNVDLSRCILKVRHSLADGDHLKGPKTRAGIRDVPIPSHLAELLREWLQRHYVDNERQLLFRTPNGALIARSTFHQQFWRPLLERAGFELDDAYHFHALRHFAASWMIECNFPLTEVAHLLGHASFDMTLQVYAHPVSSPTKRHAAMEQAAISLMALPAPNATQARSAA